MMTLCKVAGALILSCFAVWAAPLRTNDAEDRWLVLFDGKQVTGRIIAPDHPIELEVLAIQKLTDVARRVFGFELPVVAASTTRDLSQSIVIGTPASNAVLGRLQLPVDPAEREGFLIQRTADGRGSALALVSVGARGVLNAAVFLAEFSMQSHGGVVAVQTATVRRQSPIRQRGIYAVACWGLAPRYTRQDWEHMIDTMAEDGINFIYFNFDGLFRSKLFPESLIYPETPLTTEDIRLLIQHAHSRGIDFYLGMGVFAWFGVDDIAKYHAEFRDIGVPYMSRTLPASRQAMKSYLLELYDTFPEADGMWLEIGDEGEYGCKNPVCLTPLDDFGSTVSGQVSTAFLKEFSTELWKTHPQAKLGWAIGYPEAHKWDVKYYEDLRQNFRDPRYYFLDGRQNWVLQDHEGVLKPLRELSPNAMHWDQYYKLALRDIGERARRVWEDGLAGYVVAFEPGFNSHSVYGRSIPFPVDAIPYRLTRFAYREFTFDPSLSWTGFRLRLLDSFFGDGANPELVDLTLTLFEFMRTGPISGYFTELTEPVDGSGYGKMLKPRLAAIEARLNGMEPGLGPRAKSVGLPLLRRTITDLRKGYSIE
jgi:hypothetical protein